MRWKDTKFHYGSLVRFSKRHFVSVIVSAEGAALAKTRKRIDMHYMLVCYLTGDKLPCCYDLFEKRPAS